MKTKTFETTRGVVPLDDMLNALFKGFAPIRTDRRTDMRDCANYFEPLKDEEDGK